MTGRQYLVLVVAVLIGSMAGHWVHQVAGWLPGFGTLLAIALLGGLVARYVNIRELDRYRHSHHTDRYRH